MEKSPRRSAHQILVLFLVFVGGTLPGCASYQVRIDQKVSDRLGDYREVVVMFPYNLKNPLSESEIADLSKQIAEGLWNSGAFSRVESHEFNGGASGDLLVKCSVVSLKEVGALERFRSGGTEDRASSSLEVVLVDMREDRVLGKATIRGEAGQTVFSGFTINALNEATQGVVNFVLENL